MANTTADKLEALETTKEQIRQAIIYKGVEVPEDTTFRQYAAKVRSISGGGGGGDVVSAFGIGQAKNYTTNDKVILNYASTMLPNQLEVTDASFTTDYDNYWRNFVYCDRNRVIMMAKQSGTGNNMPVLFTRQADGSFKYAKTLSTTSSQFNGFIDVQPYALFRNTQNGIYRLDADNTLQPVSSSNTIPGTMTFNEDYTLACSGGSNPILLKNTGTNWEPITTSNLNITGKAATTAYGLIDNKIVVLYRDNAYTYTYTDEGVTTLLGTSSLQSYNNFSFPCWCWFENGTKLITGLGYNSSDNPPFGLTVWDVSVNDAGVYSFVINETLQNQVLNYTAGQVGWVKNIMRVDDKIYVWNDQGLVVLKWDGTSFEKVDRPFADYDYNGIYRLGNFFINPIDRMMIMQVEPTKCIVRYLDAPVGQSWIGSEPEGGLFLPSVSLTGFVQENNNGVLETETKLDPSATVPEYADTGGLTTTLTQGQEQFLNINTYGTQANANNANNITFFGFRPKTNTKFNQILINGRTDGGAATTTEKYLKLFVWDEEQNIYTFVACSTNTQTVAAGSQGEWNFEEQNLTANTYYGFGFSTDNTAAWSGLTGCGVQTQATEEWLNTKLKCTTQTTNPPTSWFPYIPVVMFGYKGLFEGYYNIDYGYYKTGNQYIQWHGRPWATLANVEGAKAPTMKLYLAQNGSQTVPVITQTTPTLQNPYYLQDVVLSNTLDYFLPESPYGLAPSVTYGYDASSFTQPILMESGEVDGSTPASFSTYWDTFDSYKAFDGDAATYFEVPQSITPFDLGFYYPKYINVTQVNLIFTSTSYIATAGKIQGCSDFYSDVWEDIGSFSDNTSDALAITCTPTKTYKYIRLYVTSHSGAVRIQQMEIEGSLPFYGGDVTFSEGYRTYNDVRYQLGTKTTKTFSNVIVGDKATTMYVWLTRSGMATDFVVSVNAPSGVDASYNVQPIYLNNDLTMFVEELEPTPTPIPTPEYGGSSITITGSTSGYDPILPESQTWDTRVYIPEAGYYDTGRVIDDDSIYLLTATTGGTSIRYLTISSVPNQYSDGSIEKIEWVQKLREYNPNDPDPSIELVPHFNYYYTFTPNMAGCLFKRMTGENIPLILNTFSDYGSTLVDDTIDCELRKVQVKVCEAANVEEKTDNIQTNDAGSFFLISASSTGESYITLSNSLAFDSICLRPGNTSINNSPISIYSMSDKNQGQKIYEGAITFNNYSGVMNLGIGRGYTKIKIVFDPTASLAIYPSFLTYLDTL